MKEYLIITAENRGFNILVDARGRIKRVPRVYKYVREFGIIGLINYCATHKWAIKELING
jgi:hypothetical protein